MKHIELMTNESVLIIGVTSEKIIPDIKYEISGIIIPILIDSKDKELTGRIWSVKDPIIFNHDNCTLTKYNDTDISSLSCDIKSNKYIIHYKGCDVLSLYRKIYIDEDGTEYCIINIDYDDYYTFGSIITKSCTATEMDILIRNNKTGNYI